MSQMIDFLEAIWPPDNTPSGYISAFASPGNQSIHATTADELEAAVGPLLKTSNLYFRATLIGNLPADGKRGGADLATYMPGVWADIDIKGPAHAASNLPPNLDAAILAAYSLGPDPTIIVHTGNGIQAWWLFKEPEAPNADLVSRWQRGLAQASGWSIDNTADLARLMRLPGTYNLKDPANPKPVKYKTSNIRHNPSDLAALVSHIPSVPVSVPSTHRPSSPAAILPILQGCSWLKHCYDAAERLPYPEWYRMLGLLAACEDGHATAHKFSLAHPGYKPTETDKRFEQAAQHGPPTCAYIRSMGHDCSRCKHEGKIISPIVISRKKAPPVTAESWGDAVLDAPPVQHGYKDPPATSEELAEVQSVPIEQTEPNPLDTDTLLTADDPAILLAMAPELARLSETDFQLLKSKAKAKFGSKLSGGDLEKCVKSERKKLEYREPPTPEGWKSLLIFNNDRPPRPKQHVFNAQVPLVHAPEFEGSLAFNQLTRNVEITRKIPIESEPGTLWADHHGIKLAMWAQENGLDINTAIAREAAIVVAHENQYHPVQDYLKSLTWDGTPRIHNWLNTYFGVEENPYSRAVGSRWLISGVARAMRPGCKADHMLILEGIQGMGKSSALEALAGQWFTDEVGEMGEKDAALAVQRVWIVEFGELDSFKRTAEINTIKAFISRRVDRIRPPYGTCVIEAPRPCIFAGSTNEEQYLVDSTGNRRYWPVKCHWVKTAALQIDRDQLWSEAMSSYLDGKVWWFEEKEIEKLAEVEQFHRTQADAWENLIKTWLEKHALDTPSGEFEMDDIYADCLKLERSQWGRATSTRIGSILHTLGASRKRVMKDGIKRSPYLNPYRR